VSWPLACEIFDLKFSTAFSVMGAKVMAACIVSFWTTSILFC
jgi:hypothetical protein